MCASDFSWPTCNAESSGVDGRVTLELMVPEKKKKLVALSMLPKATKAFMLFWAVMFLLWT